MSDRLAIVAHSFIEFGKNLVVITELNRRIDGDGQGRDLFEENALPR